MVQNKCCKSNVFWINNNLKPYYGTGHEKNPDFENIGVHVYYIGGRIKGLKIGETPPKSWLLASLQFPKRSPSLHN
jgi:hypothetical protein